jgi:hypothetical protein
MAEEEHVTESYKWKNIKGLRRNFSIILSKPQPADQPSSEVNHLKLHITLMLNLIHPTDGLAGLERELA